MRVFPEAAQRTAVRRSLRSLRMTVSKNEALEGRADVGIGPYVGRGG